MSLAVALDFADNPRPFHSMAAPADTNSELYEAIRVLATEYRALSQPAESCPGCEEHTADCECGYLAWEHAEPAQRGNVQ